MHPMLWNSITDKMMKLTPSGKDWLVSCLDPYHDFQQTIEGFPDMRSTPSVVQVHNQRVTLTVPTSAGGGNWDTSIWYTGLNVTETNLVNSSTMQTTTPTLGAAYDSGAMPASVPFGAFVVQSGAAGVAINYGAPGATDHRSAYYSAKTNCNHRLIGVAIEVANTTAEMYKQGSVTVGMLPDVDYDRQTVTYVDTAAVAPYEVKDFSALRCACPVSVVGSLQAVPTASTWPAARGMYAIPRLQVCEPPVADVYGPHTAVYYYGPTAQISRVMAGAAIGGKTFPIVNGGSISGFSPMQIYFTGLSNSTSLTVTFRTIVEYFPPVTAALGSAASDLLPFVTPSPPSDPKALALYSATVAKAPYAVPVDMNSAGEYFAMVTKAIAQVAPMVAGIFSSTHPAIGLAATATGMISQAISKELSKRKKVQAVAGAGAMPRLPPKQAIRPQKLEVQRKGKK